MYNSVITIKMIITVLIVIILCIIFLTYGKPKNESYPMYPGALPIIGNLLMMWGDGIHVFNMMKKLAEKCIENDGPVALQLGLFTKSYVLADPEDSATALNGCLDKHYVYSFGKEWIGDGLVTADAHRWMKIRKFLHPMFSLSQIKSFMPVFNKQARRLVEKFVEQEGKGAFNPEHDILLVTLETICQTALGADVIEHFTKTKYVDAINNFMDILTERFSKFWLHSQYTFKWSSLKKKHDKELEVIDKLSYELIAKRKSELNSEELNIDKNNDFQPFIDTLLKESQKGYTDKEIYHDINTVIVAGYDTTANSLIFCLMLLGHHSDVQAKLYEEVKDVFSNSDRDVDKDDLVKLVYLDAVMKETVRLFPVVPVVGRHTSVDLRLKKHTIPAGSDIMVSIYGLNHHPMWGPDVNEFRPERWLDGTLPRDPNLFASFGLGKRSCIGKTYNILAFKTTISHLIRRFHVSADISKLVLKSDSLLKPASGQHIILEPRIKLF